MNASDFLIQRLLEWGVRRIYGYPGDGINGIMGALGRAGDAISFIQVRHEEMAAFMACAHAKFTGETGVCLATSGPGAIHLLNGLYDAAGDHVPVVAIVGDAATTAIGGSYQQEVDLQTLFKDVAHEYVTTVSNPVAMRHAVDRAFRTAAAMRCVTCIIIPKDIQEERAEKPPHQHNTLHSSPGYSKPVVVPRRHDLRRAADILNEGKKVAMLVGAGALRATEEVLAVAERLQAGVAKALLGKAVVPDDVPFVTGTIGLLGTSPSSMMMRECDTLLMVGTSFPYAEFLPKEGQARGIQIDIDARNLGLRYPTELNLVGNAVETLRELLPMLDQKTDTQWRDRIEREIEQWKKLEEDRAQVAATPINPQLLFVELSKRLPDRAILTGDAGTSTNWFARNIYLRSGMMASLSGGLATMGSAVPYAIAAKFAYPDRVAIALTGDGAMQMNGNAELLTIAKYYNKWNDPRLIIQVANNRDLNQVTWEMRVMSGNPKYDPSQDLPAFNYAQYAESVGLRGIRVEKPDQIGPAWDEALNANRPVIIDAIVDPNVVQLPPHITFEEAKKFMSAIAKGDPQEGPIITEAVRTMLAGVMPHRH